MSSVPVFGQGQYTCQLLFAQRTCHNIVFFKWNIVLFNQARAFRHDVQLGDKNNVIMCFTSFFLYITI